MNAFKGLFEYIELNIRAEFINTNTNKVFNKNNVRGICIPMYTKTLCMVNFFLI